MSRIFLLISFFSISVFSQSEITIPELKDHILFLTSEANAGREPGGKENKEVVRYLKREFKKSGLKTKKQDFVAQLRVFKGEAEKREKTWNVIAWIEGNDEDLKDEYIVLGAHYDHLGLGSPSSKSDKKLKLALRSH